MSTTSLLAGIKKALPFSVEALFNLLFDV